MLRNFQELGDFIHCEKIQVEESQRAAFGFRKKVEPLRHEVRFDLEHLEFAAGVRFIPQKPRSRLDQTRASAEAPLADSGGEPGLAAGFVPELSELAFHFRERLGHDLLTELMVAGEQNREPVKLRESSAGKEGRLQRRGQ